MNIVFEKLDDYIAEKIGIVPKQDIVLDYSTDDIEAQASYGKVSIDYYLETRIFEHSERYKVISVLVSYKDYYALVKAIGARLQFVHLRVDTLPEREIEAIKFANTNIIPVTRDGT